MNIVLQRCLIHENREAIARCPSCRQYFCRECVTEHDQKFICASCLRKSAGKKDFKVSPIRWAIPVFQVAGGVIAAWIFFYVLGELLIQIPPNLHDPFATQSGGP
jgi:hypothetical protein